MTDGSTGRARSRQIATVASTLLSVVVVATVASHWLGVRGALVATLAMVLVLAVDGLAHALLARGVTRHPVQAGFELIAVKATAVAVGATALAICLASPGLALSGLVAIGAGALLFGARRRRAIRRA